MERLATLANQLGSTEVRASSCCQTLPVYSIPLTQDVGHKRKCVVSDEVLVAEPIDVDGFKSLADFRSLLESDAFSLSDKSDPKKAKNQTELVDENEQVRRYPKILLTDSLFAKMFRRCLNEEGFWCSQSMKYIIEKKCLPRRFYEDLFSCILKFNALDLLESCVGNVALAPEGLLVSIVRLILKKDVGSKQRMQQLSQKVVSTRCPLQILPAKYLCFAVMMPVNEAALQAELVRVSQNEALALVQFLHYALCLLSPELVGDASKKRLCLPAGLEGSQLIMWLELLMNTHLMSFVATPSLRPIILGIRKTMQIKMKFCDTLFSLGPYLEFLHKPFRFRDTAMTGVYQIESLTL